MMESNSPCELMLPYFLKELPSEAAVAFEAHLNTCPACLEHLKELQQVWQALPYEMDEIDVPETMKSQMLDRIMDELGLEQERATEPQSGEQPMDEAENKIKSIPWYWKRFVAAAAAIIVVAGGMTAWELTGRFGGQTSPVVSVPSQTPVGERYMLKPFDPSMPTAQGTAWIERKGDAKQLVLRMNGLQDMEGEQAYQLWVIKEGKRYNGGTFRADANGNAVLTYDLQATQGSFEALGITLEPDAHGVQPRGKKVLGT